MNEKDIKERIKDNRYAVGALISLCPTDKYTSFDSRNDANVLNNLAEYYHRNGFLTEKQIQLIRIKLNKYASLLTTLDIKPVDTGKFKLIPKKSKKVKEAEKLDDETIKLTFPYDQELIQKIKRINGRTFISQDKSWHIPLTLTNLETIIKYEFNLSEDLKSWYDEVNQAATALKVPGLEDVLRPFQKQAVGFIESKNGRALIADQQGLGKTLEAIAWIQYHKNNKNIFPVLIICPAAVKYNWLSEFDKFTALGDDVEILSGTKPFSTTKNILIINYDILKDWKTKIINDIKPKTVIADEVHKAKNEKSKRTKSFVEIGKKVKNVIGLTGTPILNKPIEIFMPLKVIKPTLFPNKKAYAYRFCDAKFNGFGMNYNGAKNTIELHQILVREVLLRRKKEDVAKELPDKVRTMLPLEIDNKQDYNHAYTDLIDFLKQIDPQKAMRAMRARTLSKINTLKQLAVKGKLNQAASWIEDVIENEKLVVFVHYKNTVEMLKKKFGDQAVAYVGGMSEKQRKHVESEFWNNDDVRLFIGNIEAAGTGINLQVASNVAFLEYPWSPGLFRQCEDRCHRLGQKDVVNVYNLIARNTIEYSIVTKLEEKAKVVSQVIDGDDSDSSGIFNELMNEFIKEARKEN